jgi:hypothetical protein
MLRAIDLKVHVERPTITQLEDETEVRRGNEHPDQRHHVRVVERTQ